MKSEHEVYQRSQQGNCTETLDVLHWLTHSANKYDEELILIAGGLIKLLRDDAFFRDDGSPIDDDIDFLASYSAFDFVAGLEPLLWREFGWSFRFFVNCDGYTVFAQLFAACGHKVSGVCRKSKQIYPGIDLYAMHKFKSSGAVSIMWEQEFKPNFLLFPVRHHALSLPGNEWEIDFQIPHNAEIMLTCTYGNWSVYSKDRLYDKRDRDDCTLNAARKLGYYNETLELISSYSPYYHERG